MKVLNKKIMTNVAIFLKHTFKENVYFLSALLFYIYYIVLLLICYQYVINLRLIGSF